MIRGLKTGEHIVLRSVVPEVALQKLRLVSNRLGDTNSRPIYIADETSLGENKAERYKSAGLTSVLAQASPWLRAMIGERWLILNNKVLLRRTWPLSEKKARQLGHNASNLTWHQDSNQKHGNKPMVVMMVALQDGAGLTRPGLSILKSSTERFEGVFGYQGNRVDEFEKDVRQRYGGFNVATPVLNAGDVLIFDGLTFHRTYSDESMNSHRDALLIRAIRPEDADNFPKGPHLIVKTI